jgi:DNA-binding NarL/FixJ family response regulator
MGDSYSPEAVAGAATAVTYVRRHLAPADRKVLTGVVQGWSSKQISRDLGVSINTVKSMRRRIYGLLAVSNSAGAVAVALREGLVDAEPLVVLAAVEVLEAEVQCA